MSRANTWFNKMDRLFLLSPSFYTILSGALIGASINLLTGLIFTKEALSIYVILVIILLLCSSGLLVYIGLILEDLHNKAGADADSLLRMVLHRRKKLYPIALIGFAFLLVGVCLLVNILCSIQ